MDNGVDLVPLLAVPFFLMAGNPMNSAILTTTRTTDVPGAWIITPAADPLTFLAPVDALLMIAGCFMRRCCDHASDPRTCCRVPSGCRSNSRSCSSTYAGIPASAYPRASSNIEAFMEWNPARVMNW